MQSSPSARAISAGRATNSWSYWERSIRRLMRIHDPSIVGKLAELHVELQYGAALSDLTSLGIGGTTDLLRIKKHESLPDLLSLLDVNDIPHKFLGGGSNLLVGDGELPGVVLQLVRPEPDVVLDGSLAGVDAPADAGRMIDELGLKGLSVGDAQVSDRHANFFVNAGHASAKDMLALIAGVRERVQKSFGVSLENEVVVWNA